MKISNSYLEDEVREGFFVPSIMKRAWAAELEILKEIDKVCQRHGISWFAEWGTLLGAVRHKGFIPWDDDIDIVMMREDYEHFLQVSHELPEGYKVMNIRNHQDYWYFLAKVVAKPRICFEEEHLKKYNGFPYIAAIDIFVRDYISKDSEKEEWCITTAKYVLSIADTIGTSKMEREELFNHLDRIEKICNLKMERNQKEEALKVQLYLLVERLFSSVKEEESLLITQKMPYAIEKQERRWMPKEWYFESIRIPFEYIDVPVPVHYDKVLCREYGDYMCPVKWVQGSHAYPFFHTQRKELEKVLDFEIPGYRFSKESAQRQKADRRGSLKSRVLDIYKQLKNMACGIKQKSVSKDMENLDDMLVDAQQLAIKMGTMIDHVKGEGLKTVTYLEQYCELLFQIHSGLKGKTNCVDFQTDEMETIISKIKDVLYQEVIERKEIVFLSYKAKHWDTMEAFYQKAVAEPDCDVYVISVPYYDKNYLGNFIQLHDETKLLAEKLPVSSFDAFDFELHHPDCVVIQNPYDEYNMATSVDKFCYSKNLQLFTECLIYMPYFTVDEFSKDDAAYIIMQYYCNMPGVVNADKVLVQSDNMRKLYIEKLTEFAGEETRTVWEKKIYEKDTMLKKDIIKII